jgi:hypothetical protein
MDGLLNLPAEKYSHGLREMVAREAGIGSYVIETVERCSGGHVPKRQAEKLVVKASVDFDEFYAQSSIESPEEHKEARTTDMKGIVMRPATQKAALKKRAHRLSKRLSPGEKSKTNGQCSECLQYCTRYSHTWYGIWWFIPIRARQEKTHRETRVGQYRKTCGSGNQ